MGSSEGYELIDCGEGVRIERFGPYIIERPCAQAFWPLQNPLFVETRFSRKPGGGWEGKKLPDSWKIEYNGISLLLSPTDFGHLGIFPEHATLWPMISKVASGNVLNLFAYSGATTAFLAKNGCSVCHVDASKTSIEWAKENAAINGLKEAPIRWIIDDAMKFVKREEKRGKRYQGILLDPPSFGRGPQGQVFKFEEHVMELLTSCKQILAEDAGFFLFTCHTPGVTPLSLHQVFSSMFTEGSITADELFLSSKKGFKLPLGSYVLWRKS